MTSVCVLVLIGATVTFWLVSLARKWFLGSSNIDLSVAGPEALCCSLGSSADMDAAAAATAAGGDGDCGSQFLCPPSSHSAIS